MAKLVVKNSVHQSPVLRLGSNTLHYSTLIALLSVVFIFFFTVPSFLSMNNLANILSQSAVLALVAIGLCFIVTSGGIDLSIAVSFDLGAMVAVIALQSGLGWIPAILLGLTAGATVGLFNSFFVVKLKISAFLVTLGTLFIGESIEKIFTRGGEPIYLPGMDEAFQFLGRGSFLVFESSTGAVANFKFSILLALFIAVVAHFTLKRTVYGRKLYAIGSSQEAARLSGIPVGRYTIYAFVITGVICALAGIIGSSVLTAFTPLSGRYYLMDAIGAVFISSTLSRQARVNIPGTIIGVLFFGIVANGLNLMGISYYWQGVVRGILIFLILAGNSIITNKRK
ncbi:ABC transporter permease [Bacillus nitroreducens]